MKNKVPEKSISNKNMSVPWSVPVPMGKKGLYWDLKMFGIFYEIVRNCTAVLVASYWFLKFVRKNLVCLRM